MLLKSIILAVASSFIGLFTHLLICAFRKGRRFSEPLIFELERQAILLLAIWLFYFGIYCILFFIPSAQINNWVDKFSASEKFLSFFYGLIFYCSLSFIYLSVYYLVARSVSATILGIVGNSTERRLSVDEIKKIYSPENKYQLELKGMLEGGFIIKEGDYYKNSLKGRLWAKTARCIKLILKLGPGG
jgi:hypothetical protein